MKALKILALLSILTVTSSFADITGSKHDLSTGSGGVAAAASGVDEICVFCHTPHAANTSFAGAPLWNKDNIATADGGWTMYGATVGGTSASANPSDSSKACLSCHDGVSAVNSIVNAPGSGFAGRGGEGVSGASEAQVAALTTGAGAAQTMADVSTDGVTNIGINLSNDHPVSIVYGGAKANAEDGTTATPGSLRARTYVLSTGGGTWIVPGGGTTIAGLLRSDKVECASCHDPHEQTNGTFLRTSNAGSALCLGCHNK